MIYTDIALKQFRNSYDEANLKYSIENADEKSVKVVIEKNEVSVTTWFDAEKQIFGFDMIQGGCKTYESYEEFEDNLGVYLNIYTIFIPAAKIVADAFEVGLGHRSVYDNFSGNKQDGYVAHFKVLGKTDQNVLVQRIPEGYSAKLVSYAEDGSKYKVLTEYKYELDDVGTVSVIPTIYYYINKLYENYESSDQYKISRVGMNSFVFNIDGLEIAASVEFSYKSLMYKISTVGDYEFNRVFNPSEEGSTDIYNLSSLYLYCKDFYDTCKDAENWDTVEQVVDTSNTESNIQVDNNEFAETVEEGSDLTDDFAESSENTSEDSNIESNVDSDIDSSDTDETDESILDNDSSVESSDENLSESSECDEDIMEVSDDCNDSTPEEVIESAVEQTGLVIDIISSEPANTEEVENTVDFMLKVIKSMGSTITGIQFSTNNSIFIISIEKAKNLGLPINRISTSVNLVNRGGIMMTEDEVNLHRFAKDITNDEDSCKFVLDKIFS